MKLLVFAHIPPPHHGQSYMVKLMLDHFSAEGSEIQCYHVNSRYSEDLEDIGSFRLGKAWLVLRYCIEAIWCRFRHGVRAFYYVPAPGKRAALYRDWIVMLLCRPFFPRFIHHWHAVGLGDWLRREGTWFERWVTHRLLERPAVGIALAVPSMRDALWFRTERVEVVANGIPDPCPDFDAVVLPRRRARLAARRAWLDGRTDADPDSRTIRVLFLAHCTREKGVFDALDGVLLANEQLSASGSQLRMHLTVAGAFFTDDEEREFRERIAGAGASVHYAGFVSGDEKSRLLRESDAFCFPTYYLAEGQPVSLIEAMACGLSIVTTRWRGIPELLPPEHQGFVAARAPGEAAAALLRVCMLDDAAMLRAHFLASYTEARHVECLRAALMPAAA
ncbi:MAG: glycosyltransferase family 4 protein [Chthoniobacteraceae bacterium]